LQSLPRGQYDAAKSLGMGYWRMHFLIILPQALKLVIPGIANTFSTSERYTINFCCRVA